MPRGRYAVSCAENPRMIQRCNSTIISPTGGVTLDGKPSGGGIGTAGAARMAVSTDTCVTCFLPAWNRGSTIDCGGALAQSGVGWPTDSPQFTAAAPFNVVTRPDQLNAAPYPIAFVLMRVRDFGPAAFGAGQHFGYGLRDASIGFSVFQFGTGGAAPPMSCVPKEHTLQIALPMSSLIDLYSWYFPGVPNQPQPYTSGEMSMTPLSCQWENGVPTLPGGVADLAGALYLFPACVECGGSASMRLPTTYNNGASFPQTQTYGAPLGVVEVPQGGANGINVNVRCIRSRLIRMTISARYIVGGGHIEMYGQTPFISNLASFCATTNTTAAATFTYRTGAGNPIIPLAAGNRVLLYATAQVRSDRYDALNGYPDNSIEILSANWT